MKRFTAIFLSLAFAFTVIAQNDTTIVIEEIDVPEITELEELDEKGEVEEIEEMIIETPNKTEVSVGENEIFIIEDNGDTTKVQLGNKGLSIVENEDGYKVDIVEMDSPSKDDDEGKKKKAKKKKFKPHYAGFEIGMNNFLNNDYTIHNQSFMNLNTAKSWNYNVNFMEYGIGFGSYVGLVTGMGFEWSNYVFDADNSIEEADDGTIINRPDPIPTGSISKSKLSTTYLTAPLLLEVQIPAGKKRIHVSGGLVGGVKIASRTKIKYQDGGNQKEVKKDDFSLSPLRYGATFRIGYRSINIFANYYFTPLFGEVVHSDELHPFSVGLCVIPF